MIEEWRIIPGLDGNYFASSLGQIKRKEYISICIMETGKTRVSLLPEKIFKEISQGVFIHQT